MFQQAIKRIRKPGWLAELRKYLRIYRELVRMQLQLQSVYRFNFLCGWTAELGWVIAKLLYSFVIFSIVPEERGLYFLLIGTYILLTGICMGLWGSNISLLSDHIKSGALDLLTGLGNGFDVERKLREQKDAKNIHWKSKRS